MVHSMTNRPNDLIPPDVLQVLDALAVDVPTRAALSAELTPIPRDRWTLIEAWPFPPGVAGPLRLEGGQPLHGAATRRTGRGTDLLVAVSGWPIERIRCPRPPTGGMGATSPLNPWLSRRGGFVLSLPGARKAGALRAMFGDDAALVRVAARRAPTATLRSCQEETVDVWVAAAQRAGLATHVADVVCACGDAGQQVEVARRERLGELFPLDRLATWWRDVLAKADPVLAQRAADDVRALHDVRAAHYVGRFDDFVGRFCDDHWLVGRPGPWTRGLLLGEWPPTTASKAISIAGGTRQRCSLFPAATRIRDRLVEVVPTLDLVELGEALADAG
jgi:hypothetical protein